MKKQYLSLGFLFLIGLVLWDVVPPAGLKPQAFHLAIIFILTIVGVVIKPFPMGVCAFIGIAVCAVTKTLTIQQCLSSYSSPVVWMVLLAFFIARGFSVTGLGIRIAYFFVSIFGRNTMGMAYGFSITDLLLAPAIPSNTARGAGIIFPVIKALAEDFEGIGGKETKHQKLGGYLMTVGFHANTVTSAMFLTALAGNPLASSIALTMGIDIGWTTWALAAIVPGLLCLALIPPIVYYLYAPDMKSLPDAHKMAKKKLLDMGSMKTKELIMLGSFFGLLILWSMGDYLGVNATVAAFVGILILLVTNVLTWEDVLSEKSAWGTFIWFGTLLMMATQLQESGFITWFGDGMIASVSCYPWKTAFVLTVGVYFYIHYFFASTTALISAMYAVFLNVMILANVPPFLGAMMLAAFGPLSGCLTHYGTGPAPVYFGAGYVPLKTWWALGAILGTLYFIIWIFLGGAWWHLLGLW